MEVLARVTHVARREIPLEERKETLRVLSSVGPISSTELGMGLSFPHLFALQVFVKF